MKKSIGQFIYELRKEKNLTQQELADRLNVSNKAVSRWERDVCSPDLSVIPDIAELFGVTCDELLKGERNSQSVNCENKDETSEKRLKSVVNRALSSFKTFIIISLALSVVGLLCMFGVTYGFSNRYPVGGFGVALVFELSAIALTAVAVNRAKSVKDDNELFETDDKEILKKFSRTVGNLSLMSFSVIFAVTFVSLAQCYYVYSLIYYPPISYFAVCYTAIALTIVTVVLKYRKAYIYYISENKFPERVNSSIFKQRKIMTAAQVGLIALSGIILVCTPYLIEANSFTRKFDIFYVIADVCLPMTAVAFAIFLIRCKSGRKELVLPGIRNIFLAPSAIIVSKVHLFNWSHVSGSTFFPRYVLSPYGRELQKEYFVYAAAYAVAVLIAFAFVEELVKIKKTTVDK